MMLHIALFGDEDRHRCSFLFQPILVILSDYLEGLKVLPVYSVLDDVPIHYERVSVCTPVLNCSFCAYF